MNNMIIDSLEQYKKFLSSNNGEKINILIHACCAPCSSEVLNELKSKISKISKTAKSFFKFEELSLRVYLSI